MSSPVSSPYSAIRPALRLILGAWRRAKLQTALLITAIALGVAVVVAIDLANSSALAAFNLATDSISGRATHRIEAIALGAGDAEGLEESLYRRLRSEFSHIPAAPAVQGIVRMPALEGETFTLMGLDPLSDLPFRDYFSGEPDQAQGDDFFSALLTQPGAVALSSEVARRAGLDLGDEIRLNVLESESGERPVLATVAALLEPEDDLERRGLQGLILADIATAQELLNKYGRLDRIDLILPSDTKALEAQRIALEDILPEGLEIRDASAQQETIASMTEAFRLNLTALSLLALLVGVFLIFNAMRFNIVRRRKTLGTLRALGMTRREIFGMTLLEAGVLGLIGVILGAALGVVFGRAAVRLVAQTINDLYFSLEVQNVPIPWPALIRGSILGLSASLLASLIPAAEAMRVPPVSALRRSDMESEGGGSRFGLLMAAGLGLAGTVVLLLPGRRIDLGFLGMACLVLAFAMLSPWLTYGFMRLFSKPAAAVFGLLGRMAPRNVQRSLSRTAVAIAALMVAVCVSIGVSLMVSSFRMTVQQWLEDTLGADIFITGLSTEGGRSMPDLSKDLLNDLEGRPSLSAVYTARRIRLNSPELGPLDAAALQRDISEGRRPYLDGIGSAEEIWAEMEKRAVAVSEPFYRRHGLGVGDQLSLLTESGPREFPIVGVFYDYSAERGVIFMADAVYRAHWSDTLISSIALRVNPDVDPEVEVAALRREFANAEPPLNIVSNRGLREEVIRVFDRAFAITKALQILAVLVAFIGVFAALMALQLERTREFATLRATGFTPRQIGGMSLLETSMMGAVAGLLSWPAGLGLALLLIYIINRRSFGWTIQTSLSPEIFVSAFGLALLAAFLAGLYPAWRLLKMPIAAGLREE